MSANTTRKVLVIVRVIVCVFPDLLSTAPPKPAPSLLALTGRNRTSVESPTVRRPTRLFWYFSLDVWTEGGLGALTEAECRRERGRERVEKMETRETLGLERCAFWFSQELNNLTVINFARYAVRRSRNQRFFEEKGTFHDFLTNRQVNFTTEKKVQKQDCHNFVACHRGIFH